MKSKKEFGFTEALNGMAKYVHESSYCSLIVENNLKQLEGVDIIESEKFFAIVNEYNSRKMQNNLEQSLQDSLGIKKGDTKEFDKMRKQFLNETYGDDTWEYVEKLNKGSVLILTFVHNQLFGKPNAIFLNLKGNYSRLLGYSLDEVRQGVNLLENDEDNYENTMQLFTLVFDDLKEDLLLGRKGLEFPIGDVFESIETLRGIISFVEMQRFFEQRKVYNLNLLLKKHNLDYRKVNKKKGAYLRMFSNVGRSVN